MKIHEIYEEKKKRRTENSNLKQVAKDCTVSWDYYERVGTTHIYRGIRKAKADVLYGDPSQSPPRKSANTTNHYTILFDHILPSWKDYPNRSQSWICSSDYTRASRYSSTGYAYAALPVGDPVIGICPSSDIWNSFLVSSLETFNWALQYLAEQLDVSQEDNEQSIRTLLKTVDNADIDYIAEIISSDQILEHCFTKYINGNYSSFTEFLDDDFSPKNNGFYLMRFSEYLQKWNRFHDNEIWFAGPSYFIWHDEELDDGYR